jgi:hypothetical protein
MPWTPLRQRLHQLPLVLAGPILRRTESTPASAVTVWLALKQACEVTLQIYATDYGNGLEIGPSLFAGTRSTVALGSHLHLVAVTAKSLSSEPDLESGQIYAYDLSFRFASGEIQTLKQALNTETQPLVSISYFEHGLPTFLLPPQAISDLKLLHGSCRKTHGGGIDALVIADDLLEQSASQIEQRPQQLFLTGDQIYGDDVADPWLFALTDAGDTLLGWEEELPTEWVANPAVPPLKAKHLPPGERTNVAEQLAGFTAGLPNKSDHVNSHLFSFGEYCTAYLFAWSPVLWSDGFPQGRERYRNRKLAQTWDRETQTLKNFFHPLWKVRRAMANVATYMVFDDHDISDDWYLNQAWCLRVLGKPLGRQVVQNGLLAYALCQAWGNTPAQFESGQTGARLLEAAQIWAAAQGTDPKAAALIARLIGLPDPDANGQPRFRQDRSDHSLDHDDTVWVLERAADVMQWHYTLQSACHEVVVLDTRTWRGYPLDQHALSPPMLMSPTAFEQQIRQPLQQTQERGLQTFVIAPTNLIHLRLIDFAQELSLDQGKVFDHDVGDAWNLHKEALAALLATLFAARDQVIVLSGDIHYGFAARLSYWTQFAEQAEQAAEQPCTIARAQVLLQFTASAFKNAELKTQILQTKLKSIAPEPPQEWVGWHHAPNLWEVQTTPSGLRWLKLPPEQSPLIRQHCPPQANLELSGDLAWSIAAYDSNSLPDWHYRIEWIKRQAARSLSWGQVAWLKAIHPQPQGIHRLRYWLTWLWRNRWVQEGEEVVGESNLGLVQFRDPSQRADQTPNPKLTVIQDLYWCPPWHPNRIVSSRFTSKLHPEDEATPFPLLH